jgi:hypothetical protein
VVGPSRENPVRWSVFVHDAGGRAVAVVYQVRGAPEASAAAVEMSLESLGVDDEAALRTAWGKRSLHPAPK